MKQYECDLCGYVYDEAAGDPDNGIVGYRDKGYSMDALVGESGVEGVPPVRRRKGRVHR